MLYIYFTSIRCYNNTSFVLFLFFIVILHEGICPPVYGHGDTDILQQSVSICQITQVFFSLLGASEHVVYGDILLPSCIPISEIKQNSQNKKREKKPINKKKKGKKFK